MARSSPGLLQLLPWALLLPNLLCGSIAQVTTREIADNYTLVQKVVNICADTAEISRAEITLPARSVSFDGKPCLEGSFPLIARNGHPTWGHDTNESIGIRVTGYSHVLRCQEFSLSHVGLFFTRPKADISLRDHGFIEAYPRRKGVKYLVMGNSSGTCLYHDASKDQFSTPTKMFLKQSNGVGVTIWTIAGNYTLVQKSLNICPDTVDISRNEITLPARRVSFDGKPCLAGTFPLTERRGDPTWNNHTNETIGLRVTGYSLELHCPEYSLSDVSVFFTRPKADVKVKDYGFNASYNRRTGVKYLVIKSTNGSCLYHDASKDLSSSPPTSASNNSSVDPDAKLKKRGVGQSIWVWLGPVIGGVATIVGAIITAINWSRRRPEKDVQKPDIYDYKHDY